jgi:hypothetical protein
MGGRERHGRSLGVASQLHGVSAVPSEQDSDCSSRTGLGGSHPRSILVDARLVSP